MSDLRLQFANGDLRSTASYPKSWSAAQRHRMALGTHPATGLPFADNGETCRTCRLRTLHQPSDRPYHKCGLVIITSGPGTDLRLSWPACSKWKACSDE